MSGWADLGYFASGGVRGGGSGSAGPAGSGSDRARKLERGTRGGVYGGREGAGFARRAPGAGQPPPAWWISSSLASASTATRGGRRSTPPRRRARAVGAIARSCCTPRARRDEAPCPRDSRRGRRLRAPRCDARGGGPGVERCAGRCRMKTTELLRRGARTDISLREHSRKSSRLKIPMVRSHRKFAMGRFPRLRAARGINKGRPRDAHSPSSSSTLGTGCKTSAKMPTHVSKPPTPISRVRVASSSRRCPAPDDARCGFFSR